MSTEKDNEFLFVESADFLQKLYERYRKNPHSLPSTWSDFFEIMGDPRDSKEDTEPTWNKRNSFSQAKEALILDELPQNSIKKSLNALMLVWLYRSRGHLLSQLDPLGLQKQETMVELDPKALGFSDADWDHPIFLGGVLGYEQVSLRKLLERLHHSYCGALGVEFMHILDQEQKQWIQDNLEMNAPFKEILPEEKKNILKGLLQAEGFENFLDKKFRGAKRFGIDGCEVIIPCLKEVINSSAQSNVKNIIMGMAHRGRLNVLANILEKPLERIFKEFTKSYRYNDNGQRLGDVKYHLGYEQTYEVRGQEVQLSLTPNPSHLEAVNSVVLGRVRATQDEILDTHRLKVMGILVHGDAAFAGQGVVAECFGLSKLEGYKTGGTLHIVINNQIGFTTSPHAARSFHYCSDFAKSIGAPIFHVNGDDPEAVIFATRLACMFRHKFQKDVVIDIICYRRLGHNEADDPSFTQPQMYQKISKHPSVATQYRAHLLETKIISCGEIEGWENNLSHSFEKAYEKSQENSSILPDRMQGQWASYKEGLLQNIESNVSISHLQDILKALTYCPPEFSLHSRMSRLLDARTSMMKKNGPIDWATGEALAFSTILEQGYPIRLSGQDCGRGTFSQRHAVWIDQKTETFYIPLNHLKSSQSLIEIINSPLSEFSVLGYEYGYAFSSPKTLVLWEAQFGDFSNEAQVIIDQFIAAGETKWNRLCGLVMLLPHGYEGQGPEHSSARLERYLQLCGSNNMHVAYCSTPASYYHILRRQILGPFRKPLILMTPKSLLRHPLAVSPLDDFSIGRHFHPVLGEADSTLQNFRRIVICSGKVYYDLLQWRIDHNIHDVALIRLEEFYPFPEEELVQELKKHQTAEVIWCQEEPENMGAWHFLDRRLEKAMRLASMVSTRPIYVGRKEAASPSTGFLSVHEEEQEILIKQAFSKD